MKKILLYVLILFVTLPCAAQESQKTKLGVKVNTPSGSVEIQVFSPSIFRVIKTPKGTTFKDSSLAVIKKPEQTQFSVSDNKGSIVLKTKALNVAVNLSTGQVVFNTADGNRLLQEGNKMSFEPVNDAGTQTYAVSQSFQLDKEEAIYGLGQQQNGKLSKRNVKLNMVQDNTEDYVPFFASDKGYGLYWDNFSPTVFDDTAGSTVFTSSVGNAIDYYFMYGANIDGTIRNMRYLTGEAPMPPMWTFGYAQSKERYKSQDELVAVVKKYRELGVPLDGIIQDWQYWDNNYLWNAMDFLSASYSNPKKMMAEVHGMNAHLMISIWSSFGPKTKQYEELAAKNMLLDLKTWPLSGVDKWPPNKEYPSGVRVYDPYNPAARDIYWKYVNKGLFSVGVDAWWMDSTEPDHMDAKPSDMDNKTYLGSLRKVRNAYPLMTVGGVYDHQRATTSDKRVFILTRSGFAGQQRYGSNVWSGDVNSSWESLRNQITAGLNFTLSGLPYWNSDIGGFFAGSYKNGNYRDNGALNPAFRELYVRWMQFAVFTPMMRSHGTDIPREIYQFGQKGEPVYDAIASAINLRYKLMPYIYANAWQVTHNQASFMRALPVDFNDPQVKAINNQYMFGKSMLVAPVVRAQYTPEKKINTDAQSGWNQQTNKDNVAAVNFTEPKSTDVYLPAGTTWFDFWTNEKLSGGQTIKKATTLNLVPVYIKAGSIIPLGPQVQFATEKKWTELEIRVYPGADGEFTLYEDEADNYNYEKGLFSTITFKWNNKAGTLQIGKRQGNFPGMFNERKFKIVMIGNSGNEHTVTYRGSQINIKSK